MLMHLPKIPSHKRQNNCRIYSKLKKNTRIMFKPDKSFEILKNGVF